MASRMNTATVTESDKISIVAASKVLFTITITITITVIVIAIGAKSEIVESSSIPPLI